MLKIFIDCGFYVGNALRIYIDKGLVDESWKVYAFEPNPKINPKQRIGDFFPGMDIKLVKKAVWTNNRPVRFQIGHGREDAASVVGTTPHGEPMIEKVGTVDFSRFVSKLPEAFIVCSMDVEGSEFAILEKMLADGTMPKINLLDVEFHDRLMNQKTLDDSKALLYELAKYTAVRLKGWT